MSDLIGLRACLRKLSKSNVTQAMNPTHPKHILFIHGAWHGAWCWETYFVKLFAQRGYVTHTFDLPKHESPGPTRGINRLSLSDYVEALKSEVAKLDQAPIIVGHSMGGLILQKYLETETCEKAILLASAPPHGVWRTTINILRKSYGIPNLLKLNLFGIVDSTNKARWAFFSDSLPAEELKTYTSKLCGESFRAFLNMLRPNVRVNQHSNIPMLVIGAENDNIFSIKEHQASAKTYDADLIIIKDIAHDMMLDVNREIVAEEIMNWIESGRI